MEHLICPPPLRRGDRVAVVSLSSGMLGENPHSVILGAQRLRDFGLEPVFMPHALDGTEILHNRPDYRAEDLKTAFFDPSIRGIFTAIGGDDTYRLLPYLMEDAAFMAQVRKMPKVFSGFSDTTNNHLMFHRLGLQTFYGPCFLCDFAEAGKTMLPYTAAAVGTFFGRRDPIRPSEIWYEEREDFSAAAVGTERISHRETHGFELLQGPGVFEGELLGGCLESLYDILTSTRYADQAELSRRYRIFPAQEEWRGKVMFLETCEERPAPELVARELEAIRETGAFSEIAGLIVGKPQNEAYYEAYKAVYRDILRDPALPVLYNVNFGHAYPRTVLPYGARVRVDAAAQTIAFL